MSRYVWVPDKEEEWVLAHLVREEDDKLICVETLDEAKTRSTISKHASCGLDPTHQMDLDNLCQMNNLHEAVSIRGLCVPLGLHVSVSRQASMFASIHVYIHVYVHASCIIHYFWTNASILLI
jgi:hypothetical protein